MSPTGFYPRPAPEKRFWQKVTLGGPSDCWEWHGSTGRGGYGQISVDGKLQQAHRFSWELANGRAVPLNRMICHRCDNPPCVNPAHLFVGATIDNVRDMIRKSRNSRPPHRRGELHHKAKLTSDQVRAIRAQHERGSTTHGAAALARRYGVSGAAIGYIVRGEHWKGVV